MNILSIVIYFSRRLYLRSSRIANNNRWKKKIKEKLKTKGSIKLTSSQKREIKKYYSTIYNGKVSTLWHQYFLNCTGVFGVDYLPEDLFYGKIEPNLIRKEYFPALSDKNLLDVLFPNVKKPETLVKNINGFYYANGRIIDKTEVLKICDNTGPMIIKPTLDSGGGKNVRLFENRGGITDQDNLTMEQLLADYKMDFIIQEVMEQHPMMSALNESSLNTFRVMTYLSGKNVMVLSSLVRIGRKGAFTDNSTQGGVSCGITSDGKFKEVGYHLNTGDRILETDGGLKFKGLVLPFTGKVLNKAKELHMSAPYFRLISWDLSVTPSEEVALIEYNLRGQDISFHQLDNGPVFAPLLQDIKL